MLRRTERREYAIMLAPYVIGITLLIEFTAPLMIAIWFRVAWHHPTKPVVWLALITALVGLAIVAQVWEGLVLDPLERSWRLTDLTWAK